jgi:tetratricopeptide (TPR) repeat protein
MQPLRRILARLVLALVACWFPAVAVHAQVAAALKGKRVVVINDKAPFVIGEKTVATAAECSVFTVSDVQGDWLWIGSQKAFLKRSNVVPFDEATGYFTRQIETSPTSKNYQRRAKIWRLKGELDLALADLNEAIRLNPNLPNLLSERGLMLHNRQEYDKAIADFTAAIRLDPKTGMHYHNRARSWREKKEYDKALADFDTALKVQNPNEKIRILADTDLAGADSSRMINAISLIYFVRGYTWAAKGDWEKALADYDEAIRRDPKHEKPRLFRRALWSQLGAWDKIVTDCEAALVAEPQDANALDALARLRATCPEEKFRNGPEAVERASKACELRRWKNADFLDTLAAAYAEAGDFDQAIAWEQKAISLAGANVIGDFEARLRLYRMRSPYRQSIMTK